MSGPVLELDGVRAGYGRIEVLHGIDLALGEGEILTVLGPNGAGKSTLLKAASAQIRPMAGTVSFRGRKIGRGHPESLARQGLCTVPEGRGIFANLTVADHFKMWTYRGDVDRARLEAAAFERFPVLGERRTQLAGTLSGGEQQMLAVTRALCPGLELLLLDELSMGLAPKIVEDLYRFVMSVSETGVPVLVVEQFAHVALRIATRAAILVDGRIVAEGSPDEIAGAASGAYLGAVATA